MTHASTGERRRSVGFTLTELLITLALIGLLFGLVFRKLDFMVPSERLKANARELSSQLDLARCYAIVSGRQVTFEYDLDEEAYRYFVSVVFSEDGKTVIGPGETELIPWTSMSENIEIKDVWLGQQNTASEGVAQVTFEPRGIASDHVVHLGEKDVDIRERAYSVVINPLLGYIDVVDNYFLPEVIDKSAF